MNAIYYTGKVLLCDKRQNTSLNLSRISIYFVTEFFFTVAAGEIIPSEYPLSFGFNYPGTMLQSFCITKKI